MYAVKSSSRALFVALIPLALVEAGLLVMALLGTQATPQTDMPAPDHILVFYAGRLAMDGALLFAGHWMLRQRAISSRMAYSLMGGVMAAASYAIAIRNSVQLFPPGGGTVLTIGLLPTIAGMITGFLYGQFAGVAPAGRWPKLSYEGLTTSLSFDGPIRVRTSVAAIAIAATMPAALTSILSFSAMSLIIPAYLTTTPGPLIAAAIPAQLFLTMLVVTIVPSAIFVLCLHHIARALHRDRAFEYAAIGSLMAVICVILIAPLIPVSSFFVLPVSAAGYGAIMGVLYRRFAGIEPVPLPEAVIAADPNALVGADHPSRRQHSVILSN
jgi:hypothetical protein